MTTQNPFANYLSKKQFCKAIPGGPISERTADRWQVLRIGPPRVKVGRTVLYPAEGVKTWLEERTQGTLREAHGLTPDRSRKRVAAHEAKVGAQ